MFGFQQTKSDPSLFIKRQGDVEIMALLVYADDIVIGGQDQRSYISDLSSSFESLAFQGTS